MMPPEEVRALAHKAEIAYESIEGTCCGACGKLHTPARRYRCLACGSRDLRPTSVALSGAIETFTAMKAGEGMLTLVLVRLDDGPMLTGQLRSQALPPRVGARVTGRVERGTDPKQPKALFVFALVPELTTEMVPEFGVAP